MPLLQGHLGHCLFVVDPATGNFEVTHLRIACAFGVLGLAMHMTLQVSEFPGDRKLSLF